MPGAPTAGPTVFLRTYAPACLGSIGNPCRGARPSDFQQSAAFLEGRTDRQNSEAWFDTLAGEMRVGIAPSPSTPLTSSMPVPSRVPASSVPVQTINQTYSEGFKDAQAWTLWWRSLDDSTRRGATRGVMNAAILLSPPWCTDRSLPGCHVTPCDTPEEHHESGWIAACQEAQRRELRKFKREAIDPEYKRGGEAAGTAFSEQFFQKTGQTAFIVCVKPRQTLAHIRGGIVGPLSNG